MCPGEGGLEVILCSAACRLTSGLQLSLLMRPLLGRRQMRCHCCFCYLTLIAAANSDGFAGRGPLGASNNSAEFGAGGYI
jgi:hypothetical protein